MRRAGHVPIRGKACDGSFGLAEPGCDTALREWAAPAPVAGEARRPPCRSVNPVGGERRPVYENSISALTSLLAEVNSQVATCAFAGFGPF